jgi:hypothetical protein
MALAEAFNVEFELPQLARFAATPQLTLSGAALKLAPFVELTDAR